MKGWPALQELCKFSFGGETLSKILFHFHVEAFVFTSPRR